MYELWFTDDPDPVAPSNMTSLTSELDKHIGEYWNRRKFLDAYRSLLVRSLIKQVGHKSIVVACNEYVRTYVK